jgi:hypothetical protein
MEENPADFYPRAYMNLELQPLGFIEAKPYSFLTAIL